VLLLSIFCIVKIILDVFDDGLNAFASCELNFYSVLVVVKLSFLNVIKVFSKGFIDLGNTLSTSTANSAVPFFSFWQFAS